MASMDVEATAVIKKNSKNNNTKGCVKVMEKLPQHILFVLFSRKIICTLRTIVKVCGCCDKPYILIISFSYLRKVMNGPLNNY